MPRFSMKALLITFGLVAFWLSTFAVSASFIGYLIRRTILLAVNVGAILTAIYGSGKRLAFWGGLAAALLLFTQVFGLGLSMLTPNYEVNAVGAFPRAAHETMVATAALVCSMYCGFIAVRVLRPKPEG
jgi:hypothetical protein